MASGDPAVYFGRALAAARSERGLKRMQLKELSGLSYPYIAEIENGGKYPSRKAIQALATALGLSPSELVARAESIESTSAEPASADAATAFVPATPTTVRSTVERGPWSTTGAGEDDVVARLADQVMSAVEPRLREWLQMEIRMMVRDELLRQRDVR